MDERHRLVVLGPGPLKSVGHGIGVDATETVDVEAQNQSGPGRRVADGGVLHRGNRASGPVGHGLPPTRRH